MSGAMPWMLCLAGCGQGAPPPSVSVAKVLQQDVPIQREWMATLDGSINARVQPQVSGYLVRQDYREGAFVHKGDVLFEIDARSFRTAVDMAKARLEQARAQLRVATLSVKQDIPKAAAGAAQRARLESDTQKQLAANAAVAAAQAAVEQAQLNLGFTQVRSLIDGIAGVTQVQVGNLVNPASVLTSVSTVDPIRAYFPVSTEEYMRMASPEHGSGAHLVAGLPLTLVVTEGQAHSAAGELLFADRQVDEQTGTIRLAGAFPNPDNLLRPGQHARVRAVMQTRRAALLVPQGAVTALTGRLQVAVVSPDDRVSLRNVQVGEQIGSLRIITSGLSAGERVIVADGAELQDGSLVTPVPFEGTADP
jgi:RND family efflux transporter MFP subunit